MFLVYCQMLQLVSSGFVRASCFSDNRNWKGRSAFLFRKNKVVSLVLFEINLTFVSGHYDDYNVQLAVGQCPRKCIYYVTPCQCTILEEILAR